MIARAKRHAGGSLAQKLGRCTQRHPKPHPTYTAGGYGAGDPPDPIPNSEVKTRCADGTAGATRWESTAPPAYLWTHARFDFGRGGRGSFRAPRLLQNVSRRDAEETERTQRKRKNCR